MSPKSNVFSFRVKANIFALFLSTGNKTVVDEIDTPQGENVATFERLSGHEIFGSSNHQFRTIFTHDDKEYVASVSAIVHRGWVTGQVTSKKLLDPNSD